MTQKAETLDSVLRDLEAAVPQIQAAAIVSVEGLPIASILPANVDETMIAAMTAAMLSLGERAAAELNKGELEQVYVKGKDGYIIVMGAGANAVLTLSATKDVKLGLIFLEMERAAKKIAKLV
ncbi:MAG: roadblock/LC7 domain-containing protein [Candidatus Odinarchaeum yellowstonii]|uniref:Roadblock/LC7 domain-containing protein n=1 Tax=Odinarchaeota yellowstonii (strain LCB_4) TaxID=1841599 RepID=A0AAF0D1E4_ODILC|nr:MAG: roadblock/LC7 domain-containing protein [Candidatus Odinarchaeum yellowstonii]